MVIGNGMLGSAFSNYENVDDNPYLNDFYKDMQRWSFNLQVFFMTKRFDQLQEMMESKKSFIQDRTIYEDAYIFAPNLHAMGLMTTRDYENFIGLFNSMDQFCHAPDLLVYLRASVPTLVNQIQKRGREYEEAIRIDYLTRLNERYEAWVSTYDQGKILIVDVDNNNFSEKGSPVIAAAGRLAHEKGFFDLISAFCEVRKRYGDAKLVIFGDGYLEQELKEHVARLGLEGAVLFPGHTSNLLAYLSKVDLFVMSSHTEGLPIILLEAMALALPIVATKVGGIPQVLDEGRCGELVEPKDIDALSEGMMSLLGDTQKSKLFSQLACKRVKEKYSNITMADKYKTVYESVLRGSEY